MKKIKYILGISLLALVGIIPTSCSDMLDQKPQGEWNKEDQVGSSFEGQVFPLYGKLRSFNVTSGTPPLLIHNVRSEDVEKGSTMSDGAEHGKMFDEFEYSPSNGLIQGYWTGNYEIVHAANTLLADLEEYAEKNGELGKSDEVVKGEAQFMRAFAYFNLVRAFGEVPLVDFKLDQAEDANVPKAKIEEIYALIDKDLSYASEVLPLQWDKMYIGRLTSGAAKALHARTYMMRGEWQPMYDLSKEVINSGVYNLNTQFDQIFREGGENSSESVFEIQCTATESQPESGDIGSQYVQVQSVRGAGEWNLGWGWHTPTQNLADAFEPGDPRKDETLLYFAKSKDEAAQMEPNKPYNELPIAASDVVNKYYNKKAYTNPEMRKRFTKGGFWFNIRIIRYADVVLMAAEAANELGNVAEAGQLLESVRGRARSLGTTNVLPKRNTSDQTKMREYIRHERRVELAMEWDRFYDLVRWGVAKEVLHAAGKTGYQAKHALLPLPQKEIDKSNGVLIQNPNY